MRLSDRWAHDTLRADHLEWIAALPERMTLDDDVLMVHGTPDSDLVYFLETVTPDGCRAATPDEIAQRAGDEPASLILCGHTHLPRTVRLDDGRLVVNPGSVGLQAYMDDLPHPHRIETETAARALRDGVAHGRRLERRIPCGRIRLAHGGRHRGLARARRLDRRAAHRPVLIRPARIAPLPLHFIHRETAPPCPFRRNCSSCPAHRAAPLSGNRSPAFTHPAERRIVGYRLRRHAARSGRRRFRQPRASCAGNDRPADRRDRAIDGRRDRDARGARQTRTDHAPRADGHVRRPRHGRKPARRTGAPVSRKRTRSSRLVPDVPCRPVAGYRPHRAADAAAVGRRRPDQPVAAGRRLLERLPDAQLHVVPGGRHDLAAVHATTLAPLVDAHLQRGDVARFGFSTNLKPKCSHAARGHPAFLNVSRASARRRPPGWSA